MMIKELLDSKIRPTVQEDGKNKSLQRHTFSINMIIFCLRWGYYIQGIQGRYRPIEDARVMLWMSQFYSYFEKWHRKYVTGSYSA